MKQSVVIEAPGIVEEFEKVLGDAERQIRLIQRQQKRRNMIMYSALVIAATSVVIAVIQCLN